MFCALREAEGIEINMKTVIMAGGRGTRIAGLNPKVPKPMIRMEGMPILEHQLSVLRRQGFTDVVLTVGYLGQNIQDYFGDGSKVSPVTGQPFGVSIQYVEEYEPLGTAGALYYLRDKLTEDFLLLNGDIIFDVDIHRFLAYHKKKGGMATIFTHPNDHPYDSGLICADGNQRVTNWLNKEEPRIWYKNRVNAGLHILSADILKKPVFQTLHKVDLDRDVLKPLVEGGELVAYDSPEYVKDMGTPERYEAVCKDFENGTDLSGGQWQKIALARDLYANGKIEFLDEPTAALDAKSEAEIYERFLRENSQKTIFFVTHRLSAVKFADKVLFLDSGKVSGFDTHANLLNKNAKYQEMYNLQKNAYI